MVILAWSGKYSKRILLGPRLMRGVFSGSPLPERVEDRLRVILPKPARITLISPFLQGESRQCQEASLSGGASLSGLRTAKKPLTKLFIFVTINSVAFGGRTKITVLKTV